MLQGGKALLSDEIYNDSELVKLKYVTYFKYFNSAVHFDPKQVHA